MHKACQGLTISIDKFSRANSRARAYLPTHFPNMDVKPFLHVHM